MANIQDKSTLHNTKIWERQKVVLNVPETRIIIPNPFENNKVLNKYFIQLTQLLEKNTNLLVVGDRMGGGVPVTKQMLREYLNLSNSNINKVMSQLITSGIAMEIKVGHRKLYYLNPQYVVCGKYVNKIIWDMFNVIGYNLIGTHNLRDIINSEYSIKLKPVEVLYVK